MERARRLKMQRNLFVVMRVCSPVVLSHLDAGFEPRCGRKDFLLACCLLLAACCLLLLLKRVAHPWTLKGGVKPRQGKPSWVTRLELGPSWVLVLRNALEITVEERTLALEMCLDGEEDHPGTRLKKGSFSPPLGPPCGTTAWYKLIQHLFAII